MESFFHWLFWFSAEDDGTADGLAVSFDAGWSTSGSGHQYNSDTGHAVLIGSETGKCLACSVKLKRCLSAKQLKKKTGLSKTTNAIETVQAIANPWNQQWVLRCLVS